jgi:thiosulfate dehydrogenase [quinone] large subunit
MTPGRWHGVGLVVLRTLIGWHFLYEGYYKLVLPAWSTAGAPLPAWSAGGYLRAATGPLAPAFQALAASGLAPWIDLAIPIALVLIGVSLVLGLFTRVGCGGAVLLLASFYLAAIPLEGVPRPGAEGTYLLVNKTLVELAAAFVVLTGRTETIAGLDLLRRRSGAAPRTADVDRTPAIAAQPNVSA